jgi:MFS transporter, DHA2 family, methylenomycin A resistance protein
VPSVTAARSGRTEAAAGGAGSPRASMVALIAICLGFFVIQLDVTIVNVALPAIQRDIGGTMAGLQWVIDGYTIALASVMLTAGSMADRRGARRVYLIGLAGFAAGSAACALAPGLGLLIAARAVQGLGASALLPCSLALIVHRFPGRRERARALSVWGAMGSLGVALGPVLGGALISLVGWRAIFLVNLPVCAATAVLLLALVPESPADPARRGAGCRAARLAADRGRPRPRAAPPAAGGRGGLPRRRGPGLGGDPLWPLTRGVAW